MQILRARTVNAKPVRAAMITPRPRSTIPRHERDVFDAFSVVVLR